MVLAAPNTAMAQSITADIASPVAPPASLTGSSAPAACEGQNCQLRVTPDQLLATAEKLIAQRDFETAGPMVAALGMAPGYELQYKFLTGYIAGETGDLKTAEKMFRSILDNQPGQTRVRLELARVMMLQGKETSADYHFRLAQEDGGLPEDITKTIRGVRSILRDQRIWRFGFDFGIAPDSNINSATSAETVNVNFGPFQLPLTLNGNARQKSGIGQTGSFSGGVRIKTSDAVALLIEGDGRFTNYKDTFADDVQLQFAAGPELRANDTTSLSVQATAQKRWYGGQSANTDLGSQFSVQKILNAGQRIGLAIDARHSKSDFASSYSGWLVGGNLTYERIISRAFIASASIFGRQDMLESKAFSNTSFGGSLGIGGELPFGMNAGISGSISRAVYDAPQPIYSADPRKDVRLSGRAYVGVRKVKIIGFSPSIEYIYFKTNSNYTLYDANRHRVNFKLARYF